MKTIWRTSGRFGMDDLFPGQSLGVPEWALTAREGDSLPWIPDYDFTDAQRLLVARGWSEGWRYKVRCGKMIFQKPDGFWVGEDMARHMLEKNPEEKVAEVVQLDAWRGERWHDPDLER